MTWGGEDSPVLPLASALRAALDCSPAAANEIARHAHARRFDFGAVIIRQGERCVDTWLVLDGRARATILTRDGRILPLYDLERGDLFGALDGADRDDHPTEIAATGSTEAARFGATDFELLAVTHGCVALALSRSLIRRLATITAKFAERSTLSAAGRVHAELLRRARTGDGRTIVPPPVLTELAAQALTTRETVSRTVAALERRGLLRRDPTAMTLLAPHRLEDMLV